MGHAHHPPSERPITSGGHGHRYGRRGRGLGGLRPMLHIAKYDACSARRNSPAASGFSLCAFDCFRHPHSHGPMPGQRPVCRPAGWRSRRCGRFNDPRMHGASSPRRGACRANGAQFHARKHSGSGCCVGTNRRVPARDLPGWKRTDVWRRTPKRFPKHGRARRRAHAIFVCVRCRQMRFDRSCSQHSLSCPVR